MTCHAVNAHENGHCCEEGPRVATAAHLHSTLWGDDIAEKRRAVGENVKKCSPGSGHRGGCVVTILAIVTLGQLRAQSIWGLSSNRRTDADRRSKRNNAIELLPGN